MIREEKDYIIYRGDVLENKADSLNEEDYEAIKAANILIKYCANKSCLNCMFDNKYFCIVDIPKLWMIARKADKVTK